MAREDRKLGAEERVRRSVARTIGNTLFALELLAWSPLGWSASTSSRSATLP